MTTTLAVASYIADLSTLQQPTNQSSELAQRVFDRYLTAVGGKKAYNEIITREVKGTFQYDGMLQPMPGRFEQQHGSGTIELYWKAPNKLFEVLRGPMGEIRRGYDGANAWGFHPQVGVRKITPAEITEIIREAALYQPIHLSQFYTEMAYEGKRRVDGPEVDIVSATTKEGRRERFYFDAVSSLPVRVDLWEEGSEDRRAGEYYLAQFYLGDYRVVDGIRIPFYIRRVRPHSTMIFVFTEVKQNGVLDETLFQPSKKMGM